MTARPSSLEAVRSATDPRAGRGSASRSILIEGPVAGSYSLSIVNRELGRALVALGHDVRFYQRQGPDLDADPFLKDDPLVSSRLIDKTQLTSPDQFDIHTRNDWPMSASPRWGRLLCAHCYGWEESLMPQRHAAELDRFDLLLFLSEFSRDAARSSGVACDVGIMGCGIDNFARAAIPATSDLEALFEPGFIHFLHVSSGLRRKGMDVGIRAFLDEFEPDEKVRLIIKTVWNETNELFSEYDRLSSAARKRVRFVIDEIDDAALRWIVHRAEVIFQPSRGEGFLLPAAEALSVGKLVVTTRCGGNEAFCTDDTCVLISSEPAASSSHLSTAGSAWFEPDMASTRRALRRAADLGNAPRRRMAEAAVSRMQSYNWRSVAATMIAECEAADASPSGGDRLVALVSTFNQHCGVSDYTMELVKRLKAEGVETLVLSEIVDDDEMVGRDDESVRRVWTRSQEGVRNVIAEINNLPPGCKVLIQHHPAILSWQALATIVDGVDRDKPVHIELHSTAAADNMPAQVKDTIARTNALIVHSGGDYEIWLGYLRETALRVVKLPIGGEGRHADSSEGRTTIFSFGICLPHKGFHRVIEYLGMYTARDSGITARLVCSVIASRPESIRYASQLHNMVRMMGIGDRVELNFDFLPMDEVREIARSCSVGVFAYDDVEEGASSAVRVALGEGLLTIVSPSRIFSDFEDMICRMTGYDAADLANVMAAISRPAAREAALEEQARLRTFLAPARHAKRVLQALNIEGAAAGNAQRMVETDFAAV